MGQFGLGDQVCLRRLVKNTKMQWASWLQRAWNMGSSDLRRDMVKQRDSVAKELGISVPEKPREEVVFTPPSAPPPQSTPVAPPAALPVPQQPPSTACSGGTDRVPNNSTHIAESNCSSTIEYEGDPESAHDSAPAKEEGVPPPSPGDKRPRAEEKKGEDQAPQAVQPRRYPKRRRRQPSRLGH